MLAWSTENTLTVVGLVIAALAVVVPLVVSGRRRTAERAAVAGEQKASAEQARQAALDAVHPQLVAELHPIAEDVERAGDPSIELAVRDEAVWVHGVALSWRYSTDTDWRTEGGACAPSYGVVLPAQLGPSRSMHFEWPGDRPPRVGQLQWEPHITWGLASSGPVRTLVILTSSTNWQYP